MQDVLIECGIISEGSVRGVLSGKHYNRSVMCHKVVYEAIEQLWFESYLDSLDEEEKDGIASAVSKAMDLFPDEKFYDLLECPDMEKVYENYNIFIKEMCKKSRMFAFWTMYTKMTGMYKTMHWYI